MNTTAKVDTSLLNRMRARDSASKPKSPGIYALGLKDSLHRPSYLDGKAPFIRPYRTATVAYSLRSEENLINIGTVCSGVDTMALAAALFKRFRLVMQVDVEKGLREFQAEMFGEDGILREGDVDDLIHGGYRIELTSSRRIDCLILTPPCQDFSSIGSFGGVDGQNGCILKKTIDALGPLKDKKMLPSLILVENVSSVKNRCNGDAPPILTAIDGLRELGYVCCCYRLCNAAAHGLPMDRERIFLACSLSTTLAADILFASDAIQYCAGCPPGVDPCYWCWLLAQDNKRSDADTTYSLHMNCALSNARKNITGTFTISTTKTLISTPTGDVGVLCEDHRTGLFGLPAAFLNSLSNKTERAMALGNCISLDSARWLLGRVLECWDRHVESEDDMGLEYLEVNDDYLKTKEFLGTDQCSSIDPIVAGFGSKSWRGGVDSPITPENGTMPQHAVFLWGVGAFRLYDIPPCPSSRPFSTLANAIDVEKLLPAKVSEVRAVLTRLALRGHTVDTELFSRLIAWSRKLKKAHLLSTKICQLVLKDVDLLPSRTGLVYVAPLKQWFPAEFHRRDLSRYGRPVLPDEVLRDNEFWAVLTPLNKSLTSKTADFLKLSKPWRGYFKVKSNEVHFWGSPRAVNAFAEARYACHSVAIAAIGSTDPLPSLRLDMLEEGYEYIKKIEAARNGEKDCSGSDTMRFLRTAAAAWVVKGGCDDTLALPTRSAEDYIVSRRKQLAAAWLGGTAAFVSLQGKAAKRYRVEVWEGENCFVGVVVHYDKGTLHHGIRLDGSKEVKSFKLCDHNCVLKVLNSGEQIGTKRNGFSMVPADLYKKPRTVGAAVVSPLALVRVHEDDERNVALIGAVKAVCEQSLVNHGDLLVVPGINGKFIDWKRCTAGPTTLFKIMGLFSNTISNGIGASPLSYFKAVYSCVGVLWRHLKRKYKHADTLRISLDFTAPVDSPDSLRVVLPWVGGSVRRKSPEWLDIAAFYTLDDDRKREMRHLFLIYILKDRGLLPPSARPGASTLLRVLIDEKQLIVLPWEIPE